jgi:hypothetical protein
MVAMLGTAADLTARTCERQQRRITMMKDLGIWTAEDCALASAPAGQ